TTFIGAYTHGETSHPAFGFPGVSGHSGGMVSPMRFGTTVAPNTFDNGPRQGEDLLLSNCHAFDVKVWDDAVRRFVNVGHQSGDSDVHVQALTSGEQMTTTNPGRFQGAYRGMARYGGTDTSEILNRELDTWHPAF